LKTYNNYTNHKILLGILLPILAFFISMNATFAYFTSSVEIDKSTSQTGTITIKITDDTAWKVNSSSISASTKLIPGDTLTVEGKVENAGSAQFYAVLQLKIDVTKSGETAATTIANKFYSFDNTTLKEIVSTGTDTLNVTAFTVDAPNANKTNTYTKAFSIPYTFDFYQFDNSYKNAKVNYYVYAHALQTKNINDATKATQMLIGEIIPLEYQQVEYIQSTGTQWIDTGVLASENNSFEVKAQLLHTNENSQTIWGGRNSSSSPIQGNQLSCVKNAGQYQFCYGNSVSLVKEWDTSIHTFYANKNKLYIDGNLECTATSNVITEENSVCLFATNTGGTVGFAGGSLKMFYCKIWNNETLIRDFVPCFRTSDNVAGLFDKVNNVFYTNSGTGTFRTIPAEYQQVEYIESSGTQWIDTGYVPTSQNTKVVIDFQINEYVVQTSNFGDVFGLNTTSAPSFMFYQQVDNQNVHLSIRNGDYAATSLFGGTLSKDCVFDKFHLEFSKTTKIFDSCGGTNSLTFADYDLSTNTKSIYLFDARTGDLYKNSGGIKIYSCKIYNQNNVIERDFVPCYRISDNEIGLYDRVNNVFYTNSGSETFLKGANV